MAQVTLISSGWINIANSGSLDTVALWNMALLFIFDIIYITPILCSILAGLHYMIRIGFCYIYETKPPDFSTEVLQQCRSLSFKFLCIFNK